MTNRTERPSLFQRVGLNLRINGGGRRKSRETVSSPRSQCVNEGGCDDIISDSNYDATSGNKDAVKQFCVSPDDKAAGYRDNDAWHSARFETTAMKMVDFLGSIVCMDKPPTDDEFSEMKVRAMDMLQKMNSSAGCKTRVSVDLNRILDECSASFRKWAEEVLSSGGDSSLLGQEDSEASPKLKNRRLSLDVLKAKMLSHSNRSSADSSSVGRCRVRKGSQKSKSFINPKCPSFDTVLPTIVDSCLELKALGEEQPLDDEEIAACGKTLRALSVTQTECSRDDVLITKRPPLHPQLNRVDKIEAAWESSTLFASTSARFSDATANQEKRRKELRLVIPFGKNPLELPRPNSFTSKVPSGKAEAFLLKQMYDLKISSTLALDAPSNGWPLTTLCLWIFRKHGVLASLGIDDNTMRRYLRAIEGGYQHQNPYHNRVHAADVTMRMYSLLNHGVDLPSMLTQERSQLLLSCILAAAVHDYMHPGSNNHYQVELSSEVATIYNCKSPLENFSASCALGLADEMGLFSNMPRNLAKRTRGEIIELVLATDMAAHFNIMSSFGSLVAAKGMQSTISRCNGEAQRTPEDAVMGGIDILREPPETRMLILKVAIKVADLGHCCLPWEEHIEWCERLEAEFFTQGDFERVEALNVSPLMNRHQPGVCDHRNSVGFFQMFVIPMLDLWVDVFPACMPILKQGRANLDMHQSCFRPSK